MKTCSKCRRQLPEGSFHKNRSRSDGLHHSCKECECSRGREEKVCERCGKTFKSWRITGNNQGRYCSIGCRSSVTASKRIGPLNPNWKNGATSEADRFYNSTEWKTVRTAAFKRDNYTCVVCGQVGGKLEGHHKKPRSKFKDLALALGNIETLCEKCHDSKKWMVYQDQ